MQCFRAPSLHRQSQFDPATAPATPSKRCYEATTTVIPHLLKSVCILTGTLTGFYVGFLAALIPAALIDPFKFKEDLSSLPSYPFSRPVVSFEVSALSSSLRCATVGGMLGAKVANSVSNFFSSHKKPI